MPRFRKIPHEVQAWKVSHLVDGKNARFAMPEPIAKALADKTLSMGYTTTDEPYAMITTLEGRMLGEKDDWIICGIKGELYPCKPDIFAESYEPLASFEEFDLARQNKPEPFTPKREVAIYGGDEDPDRRQPHRHTGSTAGGVVWHGGRPYGR